MQLCFGTFASVLTCWKWDREHLAQSKLVARIAKCVDPYSSYIEEKDRHKDREEYDINGDGSAISKLLRCRTAFVSSDNDFANKPSINTVIENFKKNVAPLISEDKKPAIIFALRDIIGQDKLIELERKESFKKHFEMSKQELLQRNQFEFSDFLGRVLYYTVCSGGDNVKGKECVKSITSKYVDSFINHFGYEYEWNQVEQTLKLLFVDIWFTFQKIILENHIIEFIETVDPTGYLESKWIDRCENFIEDVRLKIWKFAPPEPDKTGMTLQEIQKFSQTVNDYSDYLGLHMRPIAENLDIFVPIHRDENVRWATEFNKQTHEYCELLSSIYKTLLEHIGVGHNSFV